MVAITTDTHHRPAPRMGPAPTPRHRSTSPSPRVAAGGEALLPADLRFRALLLVVALLAVVAVAVATAGLGRVLDGQRGIPAAGAPAAAATPLGG